MFCWKATHGCTPGSFAPAAIPIYNEYNVGFSLTFANLLLATLPASHGVVLVNTGVGGTGFHDGSWTPKTGHLAVQSVNVTKALAAALPSVLGGSYNLHSMLWHQGEADAGDNRDSYHADYCTYLVNDLAELIDYFRASFPGANPATPFIDGGLLPYWVDNVVGGTGSVPSAIAALNTSRVCTATADSRVFPDFNPDGTPAGDPNLRSGASNDVIHFTATQNVFLGFQYWSAYLRALAVTSAVPSQQTQACPGPSVQANVTKCG